MEEVEGAGRGPDAAGWPFGADKQEQLPVPCSRPHVPVWGLSYDSAAPAPGERRQWKDPSWVAGGACVERAEHCRVCEEVRRRGLGARPGLDGDWGWGEVTPLWTCCSLWPDLQGLPSKSLLNG